MESIYLVFIILLFLLAISDLIVGVSNDAVNFLSAAIGSKSAPFWIILLVAGAGVLAGTIFSDGMMEVARSGMFYPEKFSFANIMLIFLAVMITDVILLDAFNTFGLPTSTTVSLVFELLGASVAIGLAKLSASSGSESLMHYINAGKALAIISGILISVVIAFSFGAIVQYIVRLLFTFNYQKRLPYLGAVWGGFSVSMIIYFLLIKGLKSTSIMQEQTIHYIQDHTVFILLIAFFVFSAILQLLQRLFKVNVLKVIVLLGTFALAMAFAGNDLVNFIGVPLAGYESYLTYANNGHIGPDLLMMDSLNGAVKTPLVFLILAGLIMVATLIWSAKAKNVIQTTIDLSRQESGQERFGSNLFARSIVRIGVTTAYYLQGLIPKRIKHKMDAQFLHPEKSASDDTAFDLVRASVNLVVASMLIAFGTSLKLPLSTTYVTFMVGMGSSLSDQAWDRDSAVYRVSGVFYVVSGWFFTAFIAFSIAFIVASLFFYVGFIAVFAMIALAVFLAFRTHTRGKKTLHKNENNNVPSFDHLASKSSPNSLVADFSNQIQSLLNQTIQAVIAYNSKELSSLKQIFEQLYDEKELQYKSASSNMKTLQDEHFENGLVLLQLYEQQQEILRVLKNFIQDITVYVNNQHRPLHELQQKELMELLSAVQAVFAKLRVNTNGEFPPTATQSDVSVGYEELLIRFSKNEIQRIKDDKKSSKRSLFYLQMLNETRNVLSKIERMNRF